MHPDFGPDEIRQVLLDTAQDLGEPDWDEHYGYGLVDAYAAVSY
jgi:serine protease